MKHVCGNSFIYSINQLICWIKLQFNCPLPVKNPQITIVIYVKYG